MRKLQVVLVILMVTLAASCASTTTSAKAPADGQPAGGIQKAEINKENLVKITSTVMAVDLNNRMVTLKGPKGNIFDIYVDEEARNLPQLAVGDEVSVTYRAAVSVRVYGPGEAPRDEKELQGGSRTDLGQKPGGTAVRVKTVTATVDSIDAVIPMVTLKGPDGKYYSVKVEDPRNLEKVKVGDQLSITFTQAVAISVEKPVNK